MGIKERIEELNNTVPKNVVILAVSKTKPLDDLEEAYQNGVRDFGENKVQELIKKEEQFHKDVRWHHIGNLQRNKVKYLVNKVYLIHSLSSCKLLKQIEEDFGKAKATASTLIQINFGREESKSGLLIEDLDELINEIENCKFVKVKGIMAIIPKGDKESNKKYFREAREIYIKLMKNNYKNIVMEILSMGMTHDYIDAMSEGSNLIRIGEGIFGKRDYNIGGINNE